MATELFVCDVDYDIYGCKIDDYWEAEDEVLRKLISILKEVAKHGIALGKTHDALLTLTEEIVVIYKSSKGQGHKVYKEVVRFLDTIDEIDLRLYGG